MELRIHYNGGIHEPGANALRHRIAQAIEVGATQPIAELTIVMSSEGGSTDQGISLFNFLRSVPIPLHIHASGHVGSMAVPVFLAGDKRTAAPFSRFFFHAYDWGFEGRQTGDRITEAVSRLDSDIEISRQIVESRAKIPPDQLQQMYRRAASPTLMTPEDAREAGIIEAITDLPKQRIDGVGIEVWTVGW